MCIRDSHSTLDTVVDSRDVFLRDGTTNDGVDELVTLAGLVGLALDLNMTVLALTTGLTCVCLLYTSRCV